MMKAAAVVLVLAIIGLGPLSATSCSVDRHSSEFACSVDDDCKDTTRTCDQGYCVERSNGCPSPCDSCDLVDLTCRINCTTTKPCGSVQCPPGFACTINCTNARACDAIDCAQGTACDISCNNPMACGPINCGFGECSVDCSGALSCQAIDCVASCACDVSCNAQMACPPPSCPPGLPGLSICTRGGVPGATCDSSQDGCDLCL